MTTDPAVEAAAEALFQRFNHGRYDDAVEFIEEADTAVAAARPIIEAEADEHWRNDDTIRELLAIHEAVVRERIAADIGAMTLKQIGMGVSLFDAARDQAARIARGQS